MGHFGPVAAHRLHADDVQVFFPSFDAQTGIPLGASLLAAAHGWQKEAGVILLELQFQTRFHSILLAHVRDQLLVGPGAQLLASPPGGFGIGILFHARVDEDGIRVPVDHPAAGFFEQGPGQAQHAVPKAGDGAGQLVGGKATGVGGQHPVEGVHQNLVRVRGHRVAPGPRLRPAGEEILEHFGKNAGNPREAGAVGRLDAVGLALQGADVGQRIQVEGADQRGVQALEVEDEDVAIQSDPGFEHQTAGRASSVIPVDADAGSDHAAAVQRADVEEIERRDAAPGPFQGQAGQQAPAQGQRDQSFFVQDIAHQARVFQAVFAEGRAIFGVRAEDDLGHVLIRCGLQALAAAQHGAGHGVQAKIVVFLQGGAHQVQGVENLAAIDHHAAAAPHLAFLKPGTVVGAAQIVRQIVSRAALLEHHQIEVDQVPAGEHVGVDQAHARGQGLEQARFVRMAVDVGRVIGGGRSDQVDLLDPMCWVRSGADE